MHAIASRSRPVGTRFSFLRGCFQPVSLNQTHPFCTASISEEKSNDLGSEVDTPSNPNHETSELNLSPVPETLLPRAGPNADQFTRERRGRRPPSLVDLLCRMMTNRGWTTRLQNSIRRLVPEFDHRLVWNVLDGVRSLDHALHFFRWVERTGFQHDAASHLKIIQRLGEASKLNHARCILLGMPEKGVQWNEDMFVSLIESYGRAGIVQEAVKIFQKMKALGVGRTVRSYVALFKVILRRGRYMMAKRYFNAMQREGIQPDLPIYNLMLWGFFLSSRLQTADRFFREMNDRGISPDVVTYNTMINGYGRSKKTEEAEKFFKEMKEKNVEPNIITYTTLMKGYISSGRADEAIRSLEEMRSKGMRPNAITYSTLLPGLCDADKLTEAQALLKEMSNRKISPKEDSIFSNLLHRQCERGNMNAAIEVITVMARLRVPVLAGHYGRLIEYFCRAGNYSEAVKYVDEAVRRNIIPNTSSYSSSSSSSSSAMEMESSAYGPVICYLCSHGQTEKAEIFFRQLMKNGVNDEGCFNNLIRGHAMEGSPSSGFEILKIMKRRGVTRELSGYELLIESFLKKKEPADAKSTMESMVEDGHDPKSSLFRSVMVALFEDGRVQSASRVMKSMVEKGVTDNTDMVSKILEALLMRGHVEEATGRIDLLMSVGGCVPDFDGLLGDLCRREKHTEALKLLDYCLERDHVLEFSSYNKVLDALLVSGKTLNACSIVRKIKLKGKPTADGITAGSMKELIRILREEGNTEQAEVLSGLMLH